MIWKPTSFRVEFDAYRSDLEFYSSAPQTEVNLAKQRETEESFTRQKQEFEKLRSDVQIKLKFLDENRVKFDLINRTSNHMNFINIELLWKYWWLFNLYLIHRLKLCTSNYFCFTMQYQHIFQGMKRAWKLQWNSFLSISKHQIHQPLPGWNNNERIVNN